MQIKSISVSGTYDLRQAVLRPSGSIEDCKFLGDFDFETFHLAAYEGTELAAVVSVYQQSCDEMKALDSSHRQHYQIRGMATHPRFQRQGLGKLLLNAILGELKKKHARLVWCNARSEAYEFYANRGFEAVGLEFELEGVGSHYKMYRLLT